MFRLLDKSSGFLFASSELRQLLQLRLDSLRSEVNNLAPNRFLNTAPADLAKYLVEKYTVDAPHLKREEWSMSERETKIDVSKDSARLVLDRSRPAYVTGQHIEVEIPFDGNPDLFYARASTTTFSPPRAEVRGQSLFFVLDVPHDDSRDIRTVIDHDVTEIEKHLEWTQRDVNIFNQDLERQANDAINDRRQRLLANQGRAASLGIPLKARKDSPTTYALPSVKRKVMPQLPPASSAPYDLEPILDDANYEYILNVIQSMAQVMEWSPSAFEKMKEEDLRQHFLVQLNGHFEGKATGETFNVSGKTDILLREKGKNAFIAECKFWKGPKYFRGAIDQLLSYTAWRDTKAAILVFNRGREMTSVLKAVKEAAESHPNYKRTLKYEHETGFRFVFHHNGDVNRELVLTVLVFDIPSPITEN